MIELFCIAWWLWVNCWYDNKIIYDEQNRDARDVHLYIKSSSESCSIINETKIIDLRPLTSVEQRDAEVVLNIGGWRTKMIYVYIPQKKWL